MRRYNTVTVRKKNKRLLVTPGKSFSTGDDDNSSENSGLQNEEDADDPRSVTARRSRFKRTRKYN